MPNDLTNTVNPSPGPPSIPPERPHYVAYFFSNWTALSGFIASIILVAGWSFAHRYFATFGINTISIDSDTSAWSITYVVFGVWVMAYWIYPFGVLTIVLIFIFIFLSYFWPNIKNLLLCKGKKILQGIIRRADSHRIICLIVVVTGGYLVALNAGENYARQIITSNLQSHPPGYPRIVLQPKPQKDQPGLFAAIGMEMQERLCLRQIFSDKSNVYVYVDNRTRDSLSGKGLIPAVYKIPMTQVAGVQILNGEQPNSTCVQATTQNP